MLHPSLAEVIICFTHSKLHIKLNLSRGCAWFTHQVDTNAGSYQVPHVDIDGVTAILSDLGQPREARGHAESEYQQRLQQLGGAADGGIEIHLRGRTTAKSRTDQMQALSHVHHIFRVSFMQSGLRFGY